MEYTVYRLENVVTKKNYIGMTSLNPQIRWGGAYHGKMKEAIDAFPLDLCWKKHIEFQTPNKEQALELEAELIKWYDSVENGYNISSYSGGTYKRSEVTKRKMSESKTGEKAYWFGKHLAEETRNKISAYMTGKHHKPQKSVIQFSKEGDFISEFPSAYEAERRTGCNHSNICQCCRGTRKSTGGYIWKYKSNTN